ncbi:hypothetical protein GCM10023258_15250 [Terrabacter aeriphilus]|uniref:Uncharacterized protein n=1 Tax=Terrabacter aeriphilus TaxID=515662 RepID=A0ABP9J837_9MICO
MTIVLPTFAMARTSPSPTAGVAADGTALTIEELDGAGAGGWTAEAVGAASTAMPRTTEPRPAVVTCQILRIAPTPS